MGSRHALKSHVMSVSLTSLPCRTHRAHCLTSNDRRATHTRHAANHVKHLYPPHNRHQPGSPAHPQQASQAGTSYDADLVGHVKSVIVVGESHVCLLDGVRPDEGVDARGGDVVHLLDGVLDLALVGSRVDEEHQGVVLLNLLHGALGRQGGLDDLGVVHFAQPRHRPPRVERLAWLLERLGTVEPHAGAHFARPVAADLLHGIRSLLGRRHGFLLALRSLTLRSHRCY
mmetsp:Transcript_37074/g.93028  ORF Transcript_37074/g.93028 Transcript_37074/m.93028 type:complete len:229 (-) Transcript_37074:49-735(-)